MKMFYVLLELILLSMVLANGSGAGLEQSAKRDLTQVDLVREILLSSNWTHRPPPHTEPTQIKLGLTIDRAVLHERSSRVEIYGSLQMQWSDPNLRWAPSEASDIRVIQIPSTAIWKPEVTLLEKNTRTLHLSYSDAVVLFNGDVIWMPDFKYDVDAECWHWPRNAHECEFVFLLSTPEENAINFSFDSINVKESNVIAYGSCTDPNPSAEFRVVLARRATVQSLFVHGSALILTLMLMISPFVRPKYTKLLFLAAVVMLTTSMFLICTILSPNYCRGIPRIIIYYQVLLMVSFSWFSSALLADEVKLTAIGGQRRQSYFALGVFTDTLQYWSKMTIAEKIVIVVGVTTLFLTLCFTI